MSVGASLVQWLIASTLWLTVGYVVMTLALRATRLRQWQVHRGVWVFVLLQGILCGWITIRVPVMVPAAPQPAAAAGHASMIDQLAARSETPHRRLAENQPDVPARSVASASRPANWQLVIGTIWLAGFTGYWVLAWWRYAVWAKQLRHSLSFAEGRYRAEWEGVLRAQGLQRPVPLCFHDQLGPLVTWTPGGTKLIVPRTYWLSRSPLERRAIMEHEAGHLVRHDLASSLFVRSLASLHWFNPCAWLCVRRCEEAAEWACDEAIVERDPRLATALAAVLLDLASVVPARLGVSPVRGARLSTRVRRLVSIRPSIKESAMKKWLIGMVALTLFVAGVVQIKLVARQAEVGEEEADRQNAIEWQNRLREFASQLDASDSLTAQLKQALGKPAAAIAARDRVAGLAAERRRQMRKEAIPQFFDEHFARSEEDGKYHWRDGQDEFRAKFLQAVAVFQHDMESIHETFTALAKELAGETELERLAKRLLQHEEAPVVFYVEHVQKQLRPNGDFILRELGEIFAADEDYHYFIRAGRRADAEQFIKRATQFVQLVPELKKELALYAKEFSDETPLDKQMKAALADPLMPAFVVTIMLRDFEGDPQEAIHRFFEQLSHLAVDTGSGLSVAEAEAQEEVREILRNFARTKQQAAALREPLAQFAERLRAETDLERQWKEFLQSEPALLFLATQFELPPAEAGAAARSLLAPALREDDSGRLRLVAPDGEEEGEIMEHLREIFRQYRMIRLHTRPIESLADQVEDPETAAALKSLAGRVLVLQEIERRLQTAPEDMWEEWVEERFEKTPHGWVVRQGAREEIAEMLRDIAAIEKESAKDDF